MARNNHCNKCSVAPPIANEWKYDFVLHNMIFCVILSTNKCNIIS